MSLEKIIPPVKELEIGGKVLKITPVRFGKLPELIKTVAPIYSQASAGVDMAKLVVEHSGDVVSTIALLTGETKEWVESLGVDEAIELATVCIEVNADFFARVLMPKLNEAKAKIGAIGSQ